MSFGHCSCPDCGTTLRIRDRTFVGRQVPCPECHIALVIERGEHGLIARPPRGDEIPHPAKPGRSTKPKPTHGTPQRPASTNIWRRAVNSPIVLAWALALAVTSLVVVGMLRPAVRFRPSTESPRPDVTSSVPNPDGSVLSPGSEEATSSATTQSLEPSREIVADAMHPANVAEELKPPKPEPLQPPAGEPVVVQPPKPAVPAPTPMPKVDVAASLGQRLLSFEQPKPVSRRALIELLEELLGAPIRFDRDELGDQNLDRPVTVKLVENTTVGGVLKSVLDPAGWEFVSEETHLRIRPKATAASTP